jgi:phage gp36-like protein
MAYSTPAMVRKALVPSSTGAVPNPPTHTAADLDDATLQDAIAEADAQIDAYLAGIYVTPVGDSAVPGVPPHPIDYWSRNIAAYNATLTYRGSQDFGDNDPVARRYKDTETALKAVEGGKLSLPLPRNATGAGSTAGVSPAYNPYVGTLWTPDDFSVGPTSPHSRRFDPWWADRNP